MTAPNAARTLTAIDGEAPPDDSHRRRELSEFLRSRRERISPAQTGLAYTGRRRTPGLRREEVAQLSGVGVTWYTWLEQGRAIKVSDQVLEAISRTLLLDRHERAHLFTLAGATEHDIVTECVAVTDPMQALLSQLEPFPAAVQNAKYDLLAYNRAYGNLVTDLSTIAPERRNCMWLMFTDPLWRTSVVDWDDASKRMVANLRVAMAEHVGEPGWKSFVSRLRAASPEFAELWAQHEVRAIENKGKRFKNSRVGLIRVDVTNTWLGPHQGRRLLVYTPADNESRRRLERLMELIESED
jgi:transcriptional regulator with XRE-family HTH domain